MIDKLTPIDAGMLLAAAVMALGAFCPIVHMPIVGSITYVMGGRGDGILVVLSAMVIVVLVIMGYRRTSGIVAAVALAIYSHGFRRGPSWAHLAAFGTGLLGLALPVVIVLVNI